MLRSCPRSTSTTLSRGIGHREPLFERREDLVAQAMKLIERCDCRGGCPGCVDQVLATDETAATTPKALALRVLVLLVAL